MTADQRTTPSLHQRSVGSEVAEILRERIFTGELTTDQRVPQDDIARELGVSRQPVREAVAVLEVDGLLRVEKHRGAFVQSPRRADIEDQYRIFGQTHGLAAARVAEQAAPPELERLSGLDRRLRSATTLEQARQLNWEFHRVINVLGGSRRLQSIILGLTRQIPRSFRFEIPPASPQALREHEQILSAIARGEPDAAFEACVTHLMSESEHILGVLDDRGLFDDAMTEDDPLRRIPHRERQ